MYIIGYLNFKSALITNKQLWSAHQTAISNFVCSATFSDQMVSINIGALVLIQNGITRESLEVTDRQEMSKLYQKPISSRQMMMLVRRVARPV
jgi:hypothetical protein